MSVNDRFVAWKDVSIEKNELSTHSENEAFLDAYDNKQSKHEHCH